MVAIISSCGVKSNPLPPPGSTIHSAINDYAPPMQDDEGEKKKEDGSTP
jgi:hypothetical protein